MNRLISGIALLVLCMVSGPTWAWESWRSFQDPKGGGINVRTTLPSYGTSPLAASWGPIVDTEILRRFDEFAKLLKEAGFVEIDHKEIGGRDFLRLGPPGRECQVSLEFLYDRDAKKFNPGTEISCDKGETIFLPRARIKSELEGVLAWLQVIRKAPMKSQ